MKYVASLILVVFLFFASSFLSVHTSNNEAAIDAIKTQFHAGLENLDLSISKVALLTSNLNNNKEIEQLKKIHLEARLNFKKIEFLLEYFDHYSIKKMINGAPLPSVEPKVPEVTVIEPSGLQMLDELIFGDNPFEQKEEINTLAIQLKKDYKKVYSYQKNIKITHRHIFEAVRQELNRIFTLGVTGFDTPGSGNALPEAAKSMESIYQAIQAYQMLAAKKNNELFTEIKELFIESIAYLKVNNNFDTFNRMVFLREYIDPLYAAVYNLHIGLSIETIDETTSSIQAINYEATSIFDSNFLNNTYYSNIDFSNKHIDKRVALGKILFFDPILSSNLERSCASCHQPEKAFTDGLPKSLTLDGKHTTKRNAPTIINSVFSDRYFYDLREPQLERQIKHVVMDSMEFSTDFFKIMAKLKKSNEYKTLFAEAYPDYPKYQLSTWSISDAIASYVASTNSSNSPVDQYIRKERTEIDPDVISGFNLFMGKAACGTCHFAPTFNGTVPPNYDESESEVLGIPLTKDTLNPALDTDLGRANSKRPIDETPFYKHSFKTVTVRNIAKTAPYMHNGVYNTLEEVVDFYNKGGGIGLGLDVPYQTLPDTPLNLTDQEKAQLIIFMEALTDETVDTSKPEQLPIFENNPEWNERLIGGNY